MRPTSALARRVVADGRTRTLSFAAFFFVTIWVNAVGYRSTYPNASDRIRLVNTFADNAAARMFYGIGHDLTTVEGYTAWRAGGALSLFAALFGIFAVARPMRGDEETGRTELVLVGALTRSTAFLAIAGGVAVTIVALLIAAALGSIVSGLAVGGSVFLGLAIVSVAWVYAGVGAVANQIAPTRRAALAVSGAVIAVDFLLRIVADTTDHPGLHWATPLGWAEEFRAFSGTRFAVLVLPVAATIGLFGLAAVLNAHRDLGGSYVAPHDHAPLRPRLLRSPTALALRLNRITIAIWAFVIAVFAFVIGTISKTVEELELPAGVRDQIAKLGGIDVTRASGFIGLTMVIFAFAISMFVCGQFGAVREEESSHRLETLFALPYSRVRWLGGRLALTFAGVVVGSVCAGLGAALGVLVVGAHMSLPSGLEAGVNLLPTEIFFLGAGALLFAAIPRWSVGVLYGFVVGTFAWSTFGALLNVPSWMLDISPFRHLAPVPAQPFEVVSAVVLTGLGLSAGAIGAAWFRYRDLSGD